VLVQGWRRGCHGDPREEGVLVRRRWRRHGDGPKP
jgi:hypothetical protein